MLPLKVTRIGEMYGIALPDDAMRKLHLREGDTVYFDDAQEGVVLSAHDASALSYPISVDPSVVEQLRAGHEFLRDYQQTFRMLAR